MSAEGDEQAAAAAWLAKAEAEGRPTSSITIRPAGWISDAWPDLPDVHVVPVADAIDHMPDDCPCGPRDVPVGREDGSYVLPVTYRRTPRRLTGGAVDPVGSGGTLSFRPGFPGKDR